MLKSHSKYNSTENQPQVALQNNIIIYTTEDGQVKIEVRLEDENVWLTQNAMAELFDTTKQNISGHIQNIFDEGELDEKATVKESLTVQTEGNRTIQRKVKYYNLDLIISVGYRVKSIRGTQFRIWANKLIKAHQEYDKYMKNHLTTAEKDYLKILGEDIRKLK